MNALVGSVAPASLLPCARRVTREQQPTRRGATVSATAHHNNTPAEVAHGVQQQPTKGGEFAHFARNARRAAAAASAAAVIAGCVPMDARAELPSELTRPDPIFSEKFDVKFAGVSVDHKDLIGALVIGQTVGFVGSIIGGYEARTRRQEVERLNESLVKLNQEMRAQLRDNKVGVYVNGKVPTAGAPGKEQDPVVKETIDLLKKGKQLLKTKDLKVALQSFEDAVTILKNNPAAFKEPWRATRKAYRGVGSAKNKLGDYAGALEAMQEVLRLSEEHRDPPARSDALGAIADLYTEMNRLEEAAHYYDLHLASLDCEDTAAVVNAMFVGSMDTDDLEASNSKTKKHSKPAAR